MTNATNKPEDKPVAFCQNCGKPLDQTTVRIVGQAVFCEPCLAARLAGATAGQSYTPVNPGYTNPYTQSPPILPPGPPNPGFAALLGLIPGVGAMYNEQYGKGIVHLMVFAVLISLSNASSLFGLMAFGWVCYMVIEAHHTARARRDGLPLPNPFGLNEVSERLGFHTHWTTRAPYQAPAPPPTEHAQPQAAYAPHAAAWEAPETAASDPSAAFWSAATKAPYTSYSPVEPRKNNGEWNAEPTPMPSANPYPGHTGVYTQVPTGAPAASSSSEQVSSRSNSFPAGAMLLIGLGLLFLLTTTGVFRGFPSVSIVGFGLVGLSIWLFTRKLAESANGLALTGPVSFQIRSMRALRASVWVCLVGVLIILNSLHIISFSRSWPAFIVVAGLMMLVDRIVAVASPTTFSDPIRGPFTPPASQPADAYMPPRDGGL